MVNIRIERDNLGEKQIPADAYYGISAARARENFYFSGQKIKPGYIKALATVKKAAAVANLKTGVLSQEKVAAIVAACDEIIDGQLHEAFITETIQGGAGTSFNMNANEVIANRANELLGHPLGSYAVVKVNDDVNASQSTNDALPTAARLALLWDTYTLIDVLSALEASFKAKAIEFDDVIKMGRTHLQDAVPMTLGQQFQAFASSTKRSRERLVDAASELTVINIGATAVGTGINATKAYADTVVDVMTIETGIQFSLADDLVDATRNADSLLALSSALKLVATNISKIATDLRLMASGPQAGFGEINLPKVQAGSSIMPSKVNPVIPEAMNQIAYAVIGYDATITAATEAGELELNVFEPIIVASLFEQLKLLSAGAHAFGKKTIAGITANEEHLRLTAESNAGLATILVPIIGYEKTTLVIEEAKSSGKTIQEVLLKKRILSKKELRQIFDVEQMTTLQ